MFAQAISNSQHENTPDTPDEESAKSESGQDSSGDDDDDNEGFGRPMSVNDIRREAAVSMRDASTSSDQHATHVMQQQTDLAHDDG